MVIEIGDVGRHRARESTKPARDTYTQGTGEIVHVRRSGQKQCTVCVDMLQRITEKYPIEQLSGLTPA